MTTEGGDVGVRLLRRLSTALADTATVGEVATAALSFSREIPGVFRAGIALDSVGGRQLEFRSTDRLASSPVDDDWCLIDAFADVPLTHVVRTGDDVFLSTEDELAAQFPGLASRQRDLGTRSLVALALTTEADRVGGLLLSFDEAQEFGPDQRLMLGAVAAQLTQALRVTRAKKARSALDARRGDVVSTGLPDASGLLLGVSHPAGAGAGHWHDVIDLPDRSTALVVGVTGGAGEEPALGASDLRTAVRAYAMLDPAPSQVLDRVARFVQSQPPPGQVVRLAYALVSPDRRTMTFGVAHHPPPLLVQPSGPVAVLDAPQPAADHPGSTWPEAVVELAVGTTVAFSVGPSAQAPLKDGSALGDLVAQHVASMPARRRRPRELCARLADLAREHRAHLAVLAVAPQPADFRQAALPLPRDLTAPRTARHFLRTTLATWGLDEATVEVAELCVSELVTNAVIHTDAPVSLHAEVDAEALTVLIHDTGTSNQVVAPTDDVDALSIAGRGLGLVDALATAWQIEQDAAGTTVWFEVERPSTV